MIILFRSCHNFIFIYIIKIVTVVLIYYCFIIHFYYYCFRFIV